jgi:predicted amidohydrolase YtcJ
VILEHGRIYTLDAALPRVSALPVTRDGRVARGVEAWEGDASQVSSERIDLDGRTVVPGLADAHVHFLSYALQQGEVDVSDCGSVAEVADVVAAAARAAPGDGVVVGRGFRLDGLGRERPTAAALAAVARPVALWAYDRHALWLNPAGLRAVGVDAGTAAPPGGVIERDARGEPTGLLFEEAAWQAPLPAPSRPRAVDAVRAAQRLAHARGATQVHDFEARGGLAAWLDLHADRELTLRVLASRRADVLDAVLATELRTGFGDERLRLGPVKAFMDGTLGSRTARMLEPFADGGDGVEITSRAAFAALVRRAAEGDLAVAVHAIGDRANRDALDAFAETADAWRPRGLRPRIEHAQLLAPADVARFAALGVVASMQPTHATADRDIADAAWGARAASAYAWRALADAGATLAFGSDAPIEDLDPLAGLHAAVNRTSDGRPPWRPEQALDPLRALRAFTTGAAEAAGFERRVGTLAPGMLADLVVLDGDPVAGPPEAIGAIRVVATMVGGRWVHGRPPW